MNELPPYMQVLYHRIYGNRIVSGILDDSRVTALISCGASGKIINDVLHDVTKNAHVLQIGLTFGKEISAVYEKVKKNGKFDIFDVSEMQIEMAKDKYLDEDICITNYNAALPWDEKYDVIICNFANGDMVGHTGVMDAALKAVAAVDECLGRVEQAIKKVDGVLLVTADHGNVEKMYDEVTKQPYTAHTVGKVQAVLYNAGDKYCAMKDGKLADISPTLLELLEIKQPEEMTGNSLLVKK